VVNSSQGGGSKDTWVLAPRTSVAERELGAAKVVRSLPRPVPEQQPDASRAAQQQPKRQLQQPRDEQTQQQQQQKVID
jgi:hypothetical protein